MKLNAGFVLCALSRGALGSQHIDVPGQVRETPHDLRTFKIPQEGKDSTTRLKAIEILKRLCLTDEADARHKPSKELARGFYMIHHLAFNKTKANPVLREWKGLPNCQANVIKFCDEHFNAIATGWLDPQSEGLPRHVFQKYKDEELTRLEILRDTVNEHYKNLYSDLKEEFEKLKANNEDVDQPGAKLEEEKLEPVTLYAELLYERYKQTEGQEEEKNAEAYEDHTGDSESDVDSNPEGYAANAGFVYRSVSPSVASDDSGPSSYRHDSDANADSSSLDSVDPKEFGLTVTWNPEIAKQSPMPSKLQEQQLRQFAEGKLDATAELNKEMEALQESVLDAPPKRKSKPCDPTGDLIKDYDLF